MSVLSETESIETITSLATKLRSDVDAKDLSNLTDISTLLLEYPKELLLPILREKLSIDLIISNNLDDNAAFLALCEKLN
jgi:hypothetical protein